MELREVDNPPSILTQAEELKTGSWKANDLFMAKVFQYACSVRFAFVCPWTVFAVAFLLINLLSYFTHFLIIVVVVIVIIIIIIIIFFFFFSLLFYYLLYVQDLFYCFLRRLFSSLHYSHI